MKWLLGISWLVIALLLGSKQVMASVDGIGIHILHPQEINQVRRLFSEQNVNKDTAVYVTIPYTLSDTQQTVSWQTFFTQAKELNIIPLVRLTTEHRDSVWQTPTRKDVVQLLENLDEFNWPQTERHIIVFNEVNHGKEWGGSVSPTEYASILAFTANWAHTQKNKYLVLPAALDLSAPQSDESWDAYAYWQAVYREDEEVFSLIDGWNSHSYPNPAFSSAPSKTGRSSLRGYIQELSWLKHWRETDLPVYITETGWEVNRATSRKLSQYYLYALQHIWSDERIVAVTPFVLKGEPGPFANFSFLTADDKPTIKFLSLQNALRLLKDNEH